MRISKTIACYMRHLANVIERCRPNRLLPIYFCRLLLTSYIPIKDTVDGPSDVQRDHATLCRETARGGEKQRDTLLLLQRHRETRYSSR